MIECCASWIKIYDQLHQGPQTILNYDEPHLHEDGIARALRQASDTAVPNRLFVSLADDVLRRDGRMVAALNRMAPHRVAMECVPFAIDARKPDSTG